MERDTIHIEIIEENFDEFVLPKFLPMLTGRPPQAPKNRSISRLLGMVQLVQKVMRVRFRFAQSVHRSIPSATGNSMAFSALKRKFTEQFLGGNERGNNDGQPSVERGGERGEFQGGNERGQPSEDGEAGEAQAYVVGDRLVLCPPGRRPAPTNTPSIF
jgi:hypothetical protein